MNDESNNQLSSNVTESKSMPGESKDELSTNVTESKSMHGESKDQFSNDVSESKYLQSEMYGFLREILRDPFFNDNYSNVYFHSDPTDNQQSSSRQNQNRSLIHTLTPRLFTHIFPLNQSNNSASAISSSLYAANGTSDYYINRFPNNNQTNPFSQLRVFNDSKQIEIQEAVNDSNNTEEGSENIRNGIEQDTIEQDIQYHLKQFVSSGYDRNLFFNLSDTRIHPLICQICMGVLQNPVIGQIRSITALCGHTFCKSCLFESAKTSFKCPICREEYYYTKDPGNIIKVQSNLPLRQFIEDETIQCLFWEEGCRWQGTLGTSNEILFKHLLQDCSYAPIKCSFKSNHPILVRKEQQLHESTCLYRITKCHYCDQEIIFKDKERHETQQCPEMDIECPNHCFEHYSNGSEVLNNTLILDIHHTNKCSIYNKCCNYAENSFEIHLEKLYKYKNLKNHLSRCPLENISCPYQCGYTGKRIDGINHSCINSYTQMSNTNDKNDTNDVSEVNDTILSQAYSKFNYLNHFSQSNWRNKLELRDLIDVWDERAEQFKLAIIFKVDFEFRKILLWYIDEVLYEYKSIDSEHIYPPFSRVKRKSH